MRDGGGAVTLPGMILRLGLVASALATSFALPAQAACTAPPPPSVPHYDVCTRDRPIVATCVYLSSSCTPVVVTAPACAYGHLFVSHFESRWC